MEWLFVVASQYGVNASHQNDVYTWNDDPQDKADAWYIRFSKKVTAGLWVYWWFIHIYKMIVHY